jgi:hypothetical protein
MGFIGSWLLSCATSSLRKLACVAAGVLPLLAALATALAVDCALLVELTEVMDMVFFQ